MNAFEIEDWRPKGLCARDPQEAELFFPIGTPGHEPYDRAVEAAKAICARCIVRTKCLEWAIDTRQDTGVWGGTEEYERRAAMRKGTLEGILPAPRRLTNAQTSEVIAEMIEGERSRIEEWNKKDRERALRRAREAVNANV